MDAEITSIMLQAHANLSGFRRRTASSLMDSHQLVLKTEAMITETRLLILRVDGLIPLGWPGD